MKSINIVSMCLLLVVYVSTSDSYRHEDNDDGSSPDSAIYRSSADKMDISIDIDQNMESPPDYQNDLSEHADEDEGSTYQDNDDGSALDGENFNSDADEMNNSDDDDEITDAENDDAPEDDNQLENEGDGSDEDEEITDAEDDDAPEDDDQLENEGDGSDDDEESSGLPDSQKEVLTTAKTTPGYFRATDSSAQMIDSRKSLVADDKRTALFVILTAVGSAVFATLFVVTAILCLVHRCRKRDEGSYKLDPKRREWEKGYERARMAEDEASLAYV